MNTFTKVLNIGALKGFKDRSCLNLNFLDMEGTWDIIQISSCNNGTIMIDKDLKTRVVFSGSLKGGND
jgi:hypothetical protein